MKKSLIALAVLATTGAAFAQSSVTIYGRIDTSVGSIEQTSGTFLNSGRDNSGVFSGALTTSRYGFRGSEDLGGGLKANFQLENGFNADDGTTGTNGSAFNRQAWVGLSGGFGQIRLGKADSAYKDAYDLGISFNLFDSEFTPTKVAFEQNGVGGFTSRPNNAIRYDSPSFGGFAGAVTYALDEDAGNSADLTAFHVRYAGGPLAVALAYQDQDNNTLASKREFTVLSGTYNFGSFRVSGQLHNVKQGNGVKDSEYSIGVSVPVGSFDFSLGYADGSSKTNGVKTTDASGYAFGATYALSKRTRLYGAYLDGDVENATTGAKTFERKFYAVGVRHDF